MSKRNLGEKIKLSSYDDMFGTNEDEKKVVVVGDQIKDVALGELHPFKNHPFKVLDDRMSLSKRRGWLDEENKVFIKYSLKSIEEDLNVSRKTAGSILKELEAIGLIDMIQQIGVANIIYVKNFVSEKRQSDCKQRDPEDIHKNETGVKIEPVEKVHQCNESTSAIIAPVEKGDQCNVCASEVSEPVEKTHQCKFDAETGEIISPVPGEFLHTNNTKANNKMNDNNSISQSHQQVDSISHKHHLSLCLVSNPMQELFVGL